MGITANTHEEEGWTDEIVTDLRELNKDIYPLTNILEILHSLKVATLFSSLDACGTYHAIRIEPGSQACISPFGTFQYMQMPFGLANTGSVYSRILYVSMKEGDRDF